MILAPEVSVDRQDGAAEPASPRLLVDVAIYTQEAENYGGVPCSSAEVRARTAPVVEDVLARVKEVRLTFRRRAQKVFPVCYVENGDDSAPASF